MKHFDSEFAAVEWNETAQAVYIMCKDKASQHTSGYDSVILRTDLLRSFNRAVQIAQEHRSSNLIGDISNLLILTGDDEQWSLKSLVPRLHAAGIRNMAVIPPQTLIGKLSLDLLLRRVRDIRIQRVSSVQEAEHWLQQQRN
ncbi:MAG: hypothetical protein RML40_05125 [Bacteroidota bacterium]|nr:hypothetical protein [Candidatus Kapabacteria bacterium]MDW8219894.1 hypothetical protein [Bacteroidota bacterium]